MIITERIYILTCILFMWYNILFYSLYLTIIHIKTRRQCSRSSPFTTLKRYRLSYISGNPYGTHCNYIMKDGHINLLRGAISNKHTYFVDGRTKTKYLTNCHNNPRKSTLLMRSCLKLNVKNLDNTIYFHFFKLLLSRGGSYQIVDYSRIRANLRFDNVYGLIILSFYHFGIFVFCCFFVDQAL